MLALGWQATRNGRGQGHVTLFTIAPPAIISLASVKLGTIQMSCADWYKGVTDRLPRKGMCSRSRDLIIVRKTIDNISETVQDRDIVAVEN